MCRMTRRSLFHRAAALTAAAPLSAAVEAAAAERKRKFTMDLACGAIGVRADQRKAIRLARRGGFESVAASVGELARLSGGELQELLGELRANSLVWGAAGLTVDFRGQEAKFKEGLDQLPSSARAMQRAGVTRVGTWLRPSHDELTYLANLKQHVRRLREVAKVLGDHGQRLGLEYVGPKTSWTVGRFPFVHTMAEMKELIAEIGCDNVGFVLDSWHWYTAGETGADLMTLTGRDVVSCHLNDAPAGIPVQEQVDNRRALPAATGVIDVKTFLSSLAAIGYDGPVYAEPFSQELRSLDEEAAIDVTAAAMRKAFALIE